MVFEGRYPDLSDEQIFDAYEQKLHGRTLSLLAKEPFRSEMLENLRRSLSTTFEPDKVEQILGDSQRAGFYQRDPAPFWPALPRPRYVRNRADKFLK